MQGTDTIAGERSRGAVIHDVDGKTVELVELSETSLEALRAKARQSLQCADLDLRDSLQDMSRRLADARPRLVRTAVAMVQVRQRQRDEVATNDNERGGHTGGSVVLFSGNKRLLRTKPRAHM